MSARDDYPLTAEEAELMYQESGEMLDEIDALRLKVAWLEDIARCRGEENEKLRTRLFVPNPDAPSRRLDNFQADIDNLNLTGREADSSSGPADV